MVAKALVLENRRGIMGHREATRGSMLILPRRDLISTQVSRLDSPECKLWVKDFNLSSDRYNAPTSRLLALHHRHHKETVMHKILVLWDHATAVVRLGPMLTSVPGSRQIRL
jgi:hypothetical protein